MGGRRAAGAVLAALLLLPACRSVPPGPAPSPSPTATATAAPSPVSGLRMAVVIPPVSLRTAAETAAMREDLDDLRRRFGGDIASLRIVQPDSPAFTVDVTDLVADRGADLVCVVGPGSGAAVMAVAGRYPATEFCATPATADPADIPPNVLVIDVRVEEVAFLAGVAAHLAARGEEAGPPGFVAGESQYAIDRRRTAFIAGINSVAPEPVTPYVGFPVGDEERAFELAAPQYAAGVPVIYTAAGEGDLGVRRAAEGTDRLVIGSRHTLVPTDDEGGEGEPSPAILMVTDLLVSVPLEVAVGRALEAWEGGRVSVGLAEGALVVGPGGSPRYRAVAGAVDDARARIESGAIAPLPAG